MEMDWIGSDVFGEFVGDFGSGGSCFIFRLDHDL
jgi:hypothetical protein